MEPLRIHLFGGFLLERAGVALPPIASRAGRSLFAYLVMNRDRPLQRDLLAGTFWPDMPESRARRRLSHTLWQIQDAISEDGSSHVAVTSDTLAFDTSSPYWLDAEEFDDSFEASESSSSKAGQGFDPTSLRSCVELYRGDFMAGFFDDWVIVDQDHYRQRYLVALSRLIDVTKADGDYERALAYARRLTHHDPLSEEVHSEVMRLCFLLGRTSEAVEQFERCRSVLAEELEAEPSRATKDLYNKIIRRRRADIRPATVGETPPLSGSRVNTPFVGRDEERKHLIDYMEKVLAGPGGVVLLEGEPGVGKTRLALETAEDARWRGFETSWGYCHPGAVRPFGPLVEVLESLTPLRVEQLSEQVPPVWLGEALRLAPGLRVDERFRSTGGALHPAEESTRMKESLIQTLGALGDITPQLIILDDVQWADRDTLGVIAQMGPRLRESRILLLLLYRSEEARGDPDVWDMLREGDRIAGLGRVVLSPLSVFELEEMVRKTLGVPRLEPSIATQFHRQTGGNALFSLETLLELRDRGLLDSADPAEALQNQLASYFPAAPRVRSVIDSRMALLGEDVTSIYELAAVFGVPAGLSELADAASLTRPRVLEAIDELAHRGLISDEGDGLYRITHDQVRQVVYDRIDLPQRLSLHRRVAETLTRTRPVDVGAIGYHYWEGEEENLAASYLLEAAIRAVELNAYATAFQHLRTARTSARRAGWTASNLYDLLGRLEDVLGVLGERQRQHKILDEMAELIDSNLEQKGDLARRRAWLMAHTADFAGAEEAARRSIEVERQRGEGPALAASLVALGTTLRWSGSPFDAVHYLEEAVAAAAGTDVQYAASLTQLASTLVEVQSPLEALPHLEKARRLYERAGDLRGQAEVAGINARAMHQAGDSKMAASQYRQAIEMCQTIGYRHGEGVNTVNLSVLNYMTGAIAEALDGYDRAAVIFSELGNQRGEAMVLANSASMRHALLGDDEKALSDAERALRFFAEVGDRAGESQCQEIISGVYARQGRLDEAQRLLKVSLRGLRETGNIFVEVQHLRSLALVQLEARHPSEALSTLDRASELCDEHGFEETAVELASIRASCLLASGRIFDALAVSRDAVQHVKPGVERPYLIHHRHALTAEAAAKLPEAKRSAELAQKELDRSLDGLPEDTRRLALSRVPEHREIVEAANRFAPTTVARMLPATGAPIGRGLSSDDLIEVIWTVDHPEDGSIESAVERRRFRVLRLLSEADDAGAEPSIEDLANALGVSGSTVRRDIEVLRDGGNDVSTRGQRHAS